MDRSQEFVAGEGPAGGTVRETINQRHGVVIVWVALAFLVLLGMAALTIDVGRLVLAKQELQDVADAAALGAVGQLRMGMDEAAAKQVAVDIAASNTVLGQPVVLNPATDVQIGGWDSAQQCIVPWSPAFTFMAVAVTARRTRDSGSGPVEMPFSRGFGLPSVDIWAEAAAGIAVSNKPRTPVDVMVVQDGTGSFADEWHQAIEADRAMVELVQNVAMTNDTTGFVAFNDTIMQYTYQGWHQHWGTWVWGNITEDLKLPLTDFLAAGATLPATVNTTYDHASAATAAGYTNPGIALQWAIDQIQATGRAANQQVIVLVSDGMPYGPTNSITQQRRTYGTQQANRAGSLGIRIHTVTLTAEEQGTYGSGGADYVYNESLVRNGGYAFRTADPEKLKAILIAVGTIEVGKTYLFK